jgi:phosphotransferase system IIB component
MKRRQILLSIITFGLYKVYLNKKIKSLGYVNQVTISKLANEIVKSLGTISNIVDIKSKINSVEVYLKDMNVIDKQQIKLLGATGLLTKVNSIVIVLGKASESIGKEISSLISKQI